MTLRSAHTQPRRSSKAPSTPKTPKADTNVDAPADIRLNILNAAAAEFSRAGFAGTSLRTIAKAAEVSFQMIAYYVGSKEELWVATYQELTDRRRGRARKKYNDSQIFEERLRPWIRDALLLARDEPQLARMNMHESLADSPRYRKHIVTRATSANKDFMWLYGQAPLLGTTTVLDPRQMLIVMRGFIEQLACQPMALSNALGRPVEDDSTIDFLVETIVTIFLSGAKHSIPTVAQSTSAAETAALEES